MNIQEAQTDMRSVYLGGGTGALVSGTVWGIAGIIAMMGSMRASILFFFFAGMLIFPVSVLVAKLFNRSGKHQPNNPFGKLALESTVILFVGLFISYTIFQIKPDWFYPIMLLIIGVRYLIFQTIYGMKSYWVFGFVLMIAGVICLMTHQPFYVGALAGGIIELVFAIVVIGVERRQSKISN